MSAWHALILLYIESSYWSSWLYHMWVDLGRAMTYNYMQWLHAYTGGRFQKEPLVIMIKMKSNLNQVIKECFKPACQGLLGH